MEFDSNLPEEYDGIGHRDGWTTENYIYVLEEMNIIPKKSPVMLKSSDCSNKEDLYLSDFEFGQEFPNDIITIYIGDNNAKTCFVRYQIFQSLKGVIEEEDGICWRNNERLTKSDLGNRVFKIPLLEIWIDKETLVEILTNSRKNNFHLSKDFHGKKIIGREDETVSSIKKLDVNLYSLKTKINTNNDKNWDILLELIRKNEKYL